MTVSNGWCSVARGHRASAAQTARRCAGRAGRGFPFVGSKKATLRRVLREKGVPLTAEAQARLDALPERFMDFIAAPERFFARPEAEAA